jgi:hypothetical protein
MSTVQERQDAHLSSLREITDEIEFFEQLRKTNPTARVPYTLRELKVQIKYCRDTNKARWEETTTKHKDDVRWDGATELHSHLYSTYTHMYSGNKNKYEKAKKKYENLAREMMDFAMDGTKHMRIDTEDRVLYDGNDEAVRLFCNEMMLEMLVLNTIERKLDLIRW